MRNSGLTGRPHLHFGVYQSFPPYEGFDVPVVFRNAEGELDPRGGLRYGVIYRAVEDPAGPETAGRTSPGPS